MEEKGHEEKGHEPKEKGEKPRPYRDLPTTFQGNEVKSNDLPKEIKNQQGGIQKAPAMSKISLWLDDYSDIFSDFDPRPYSQRSLSQDFLEEAQRAAREKVSGAIELNFLLPAAERKISQEVRIKKRLKEHFKKHYISVKKEINQIIRRGAYFIIAGLVLMFVATMILFWEPSTILTNFLVVLLEPGGWFFFWEGLGLVVFEAKEIKPKLEFNRRMSKCFVSFSTY